MVSICQYNHNAGTPTLSPPVAVGRMALPSDLLRHGGTEKGKAVYVLHTYKDHLWEMGSKMDVPESHLISIEEIPGEAHKEDLTEGGTLPPPSESTASAEPQADYSTQSSGPVYTPQEVSSLLQTSLVQALSTTLLGLPPSSFPITASTLYTSFILPSRPAFPGSVLPTSPSAENLEALDSQEITIKTSSHKSLTAFLKSAEKASLLSLKSPPKHAQQSDILITAVNTSHPSVAGHRKYVTVKDIEARAAKRAQQDEKQKEAESSREVEIRELWKPHLTSLSLFDESGKR